MSATLEHADVAVGTKAPDLRIVDVEATSPRTAPLERPGTRRRLRHPDQVTFAASTTAALALASNRSVAMGIVSAGLGAVLVVLAAIDLEHRVVPNRIVLPAAGTVLLARLVSSDGSLAYVLAALGTGALFALPFRREWARIGDVKLVVLLGAGLGWGVIDAVVIAFVALVPFALATLLRGGSKARTTTLPFGPFLAFGGLIFLIVPALVATAGS